MKMGEVLSLNISLKKGTSKHPVDEVYVEENLGIRGDAHFGFAHRQVSLLAWEDIEEQNFYLKEANFGIERLNPGDFAENITTKGIDLSSLNVGDRIKIGSGVVLEVTQIGKKCHDLCEIAKKVGKCIMPRQGVFASVLKGGKIRRGDPVWVIRKENGKNSHSNCE